MAECTFPQARAPAIAMGDRQRKSSWGWRKAGRPFATGLQAAVWRSTKFEGRPGHCREKSLLLEQGERDTMAHRCYSIHIAPVNSNVGIVRHWNGALDIGLVR